MTHGVNDTLTYKDTEMLPKTCIAWMLFYNIPILTHSKPSIMYTQHSLHVSQTPNNIQSKPPAACLWISYEYLHHICPVHSEGIKSTANNMINVLYSPKKIELVCDCSLMPSSHLFSFCLCLSQWINYIPTAQLFILTSPCPLRFLAPLLSHLSFSSLLPSSFTPFHLPNQTEQLSLASSHPWSPETGGRERGESKAE